MLKLFVYLKSYISSRLCIDKHEVEVIIGYGKKASTDNFNIYKSDYHGFSLSSLLYIYTYNYIGTIYIIQTYKTYKIISYYTLRKL